MFNFLTLLGMFLQLYKLPRWVLLNLARMCAEQCSWPIMNYFTKSELIRVIIRFKDLRNVR